MTAEQPGQIIEAVLEQHQFKSTSKIQGPLVMHAAGCTCDPDLRFDWRHRETQHRDHLLAAVFEAGRRHA